MTVGPSEILSAKHRQTIQPSRGSYWPGVDLTWETYRTGQKKGGETPNAANLCQHRRVECLLAHGARRAQGRALSGAGWDALRSGFHRGEPRKGRPRSSHTAPRAASAEGLSTEAEGSLKCGQNHTDASADNKPGRKVRMESPHAISKKSAETFPRTSLKINSRS